MKKLILMLSLLVPLAVLANEDAALQHAPINPNNQASLQRGAKVFVNYCLNCHSAAYMRYNRLADIGLTEAQIKANLKDAKDWFGVPPPDLSVEARARGADWLYAYLRGFYRDDTRPTGWNNTVFDKVGMPHILWQLQGQQILKVEEKLDAHGEKAEVHTLVLNKPGLLSPAEYDGMVADLVNYLVFMGEPAKNQRLHLGLIVLLFLGLFYVIAFYLKKEFWKDVH